LGDLKIERLNAGDTTVRQSWGFCVTGFRNRMTNECVSWGLGVKAENSVPRQVRANEETVFR
jgi:hypothetical protein